MSANNKEAVSALINERNRQQKIANDAQHLVGELSKLINLYDGEIHVAQTHSCEYCDWDGKTSQGLLIHQAKAHKIPGKHAHKNIQNRKRRSVRKTAPLFAASTLASFTSEPPASLADVKTAVANAI